MVTTDSVLASFENVVCKVSGLVTEAKWHDWKTDDFKPYFEVLHTESEERKANFRLKVTIICSWQSVCKID